MGRGDVPFDRDSNVLSDISDSESESGPPQGTANLQTWVGAVRAYSFPGCNSSLVERHQLDTMGEEEQLFLSGASVREMTPTPSPTSAKPLPEPDPHINLK